MRDVELQQSRWLPGRSRLDGAHTKRLDLFEHVIWLSFCQQLSLAAKEHRRAAKHRYAILAYLRSIKEDMQNMMGMIRELQDYRQVMRSSYFNGFVDFKFKIIRRERHLK